jgi:hypothetical protein
MLCVSGNYSDHNSRSSSINDCILAETVIMSETNFLEVMTPSDVDRYQRFGKTLSLHLQGRNESGSDVGWLKKGDVLPLYQPTVQLD